MKTVFRNFRIIDAERDALGGVVVEGGLLKRVIFYWGTEGAEEKLAAEARDAFAVYDGGGRLVLTAGFVDMHAHFREPGASDKETLESACLAAARGGYTTVVCMANTNPPCDNAEAASRVKARADALGLISLYPAVSLTEEMRGERLSPFLAAGNTDGGADGGYRPPLLSEDGRDVADDALFLEAMRRAADLGCVVSCHCDEHGEDAATERAILLGKRAGCRVHIAHVSTRKAAESVRGDISVAAASERGAAVTAEATPHHIALTKADAERAGARTFGAVAPPLRSEADRLAVIEALRDGTIGVIATDHAPHTRSDKEGGAPGFSGLETAFAVCNTVLVKEHGFTPRKLFSLMSAMPARILGLSDRGLVAEGLRADIAVLDMDGERVIDPASFASRGRNTLFAGRRLRGEVVMTMRGGAVVYQAGCFRREAPRLTDITAM